jgi:hypothetical protein
MIYSMLRWCKGNVHYMSKSYPIPLKHSAGHSLDIKYVKTNYNYRLEENNLAKINYNKCVVSENKHDCNISIVTHSMTDAMHDIIFIYVF